MKKFFEFAMSLVCSLFMFVENIYENYGLCSSDTEENIFLDNFSE